MTDSLTDSTTTNDGAARAVLVGVRAAWRVPSIIAHEFAVLLVPPATSANRMPSGEGASIAVRTAHRALAWLARVRPARWRATCLHRSVAECVVLRAYGLPARVVIGVGNGAASATTIAHAWVECDGVRCHSTRGAAELELLRPIRA
jgi:Transglutaminase-like superfamily